MTQGLRTAVMTLVAVVTTYLTMERSHAEELGSGVRAVSEVLNGQRQLSPVTYLAFALVLVLLVRAGRAGRPAVAHA